MENIASKHAVSTKSILREIESGEQVNVRPKGYLHRFRKAGMCNCRLQRDRAKASDTILTNKALRKADKSLDFARVEMIWLALYDEMLPSNFS